jgi:hypothetical protein
MQPHDVWQSIPPWHAPNVPQSIAHTPGPQVTPFIHDVPLVHRTTQIADVHVTPPMHEPTPEQLTVQAPALPQSTPLLHDEPVQVTAHAPFGGHLTVFMQPRPLQMIPHTSFWQVPPAAAHAVGSHGPNRPASPPASPGDGRPSLARPSPGAALPPPAPSKPIRPQAHARSNTTTRRTRRCYFGESR